MLEVPVYNQEGEVVDKIDVDESKFGGEVRIPLLKQALVMYHANKRQGTVQTRSRSMVAGSTRKLYRQKGTGRARMGNARTCIRRGGGMAFSKSPKSWRQSMPKKMRRQARDSAILAKLQGNDALVIDKLNFESPRTKNFTSLLTKLNIDRGCLVALQAPDRNIYLSARNLRDTDVCSVREMNAFDISRRRKLLFTRDAFEMLLKEE
jgi:large subunit ribosomal protein L4